MTVTIYHNPKCSSSRNTLELIRQHGVEPQIIDYLSNPPNKSELQTILRQMGCGVRDLIRQKESVYTELQLGAAKWSDDELLDMLIAHPILMNRPIVVTSLGVRLCRPADLVLEILPAS